MSMKKSNNTIGNLTRNLAALRAVPQQTATPRACRLSGTMPRKFITQLNFIFIFGTLLMAR